MSTLQQAARDALTSFRNTALTSLRNDSTDVDIYRTLRDVSSLLYETQIVRDMFDSDPFGLSWRMRNENDEGDDEVEEAKGGEGEDDNEDKNDESNADADVYNEKKNNRILSQIQNMLQVTSCHRTTTPHGHSSIYAIVQFNINDNDDATDNNTIVKHNIRLRFNFVREPNIAFDLATITSLQEQQFQYSSTADVDTEINDDDEEEEEEKDDEEEEEVEEEEVLTNRITPEQKQQQHYPLPASKKRKIMTNDNDKEKDDEDVDDSSSNAQSTIPPPQQQQQQQQSSLAQQKYKTQISYKIDYSIDYGKFESLLGIDIYAINNYPSIYPAISIIDNYNDENYDDDEDEGDGCADGCCARMANDLFLPPNLKNINNSSNKSSNNNNNAEEDVEMSNSDVVYDEEEDDKDEDEEDGSSNYITTETDTAANAADRYGVSIHLQNIVTFLDCTKNINLTESSIFYFLLTFPYYEHEWDVAGLILSSIYNDDVDDNDDDDDDNEAEEAV